MPKTGHPPNTGHFHFLIFNHSSYNFINTKITYLDRIFFEDINLKKKFSKIILTKIFNFEFLSQKY